MVNFIVGFVWLVFGICVVSIPTLHDSVDLPYIALLLCLAISQIIWSGK